MRSQPCKVFIPVLLASFLFLPVASAQTSAPSPVTTPAFEGHAESGSIDDRYRFDAGPGDFTIAVEATTNYYSHAVEVKLLAAGGGELGNVNLVASDSTGRAARSFHAASHRTFILAIHADRDTSVKSLDYKVTLGGAVDVAQGGTDLGSTTPVTSTGDPIQTAPIAVPVPPPAMPSNSPDSSSSSLARLLSGIGALPSSGFLRIDMKDGTTTLVDLSRVKGLSYVQQ